MSSILRSGGSWDSTRARAVLIPSMTSMVLAPDWRRTSRVTVGTPFRRATERCSLVPSSASPRSRMRTGWPLTVATTSSLKSSGVSKRPMVRNVCSRAPEVTLPPGASAFCRTMAWRTAVIGMAYAARRSGSIQMLMARSRPPTICTSPTPTERSSWTFTTLSAYSVSSRNGRLPERAMDMTGRGVVVELGDDGRQRVLRQSPDDGGDAVADVLGRGVDVAVEAEGGDDEASCCPRTRSAAPRCPRRC